MTSNLFAELRAADLVSLDWDHYRLLGLSPFASDPQLISEAFAERYAEIRRYQVGMYSDQAVRLLELVSHAYACLSDPDRKQAYDEQLRQSFRAADTDADVPSATATVVEWPEPPVEEDGASSGTARERSDAERTVSLPHAAHKRPGEQHKRSRQTRSAVAKGANHSAQSHLAQVWFQATRRERLADYYSCLGLPRYEADRQRIEQAIVRHETFIRDQFSTPHDPRAELLLEEIKGLRQLLLTTGRKADYDRHLRKQERPSACRRKATARRRRPLPSQGWNELVRGIASVRDSFLGAVSAALQSLAVLRVQSAPGRALITATAILVFALPVGFLLSWGFLPGGASSTETGDGASAARLLGVDGDPSATAMSWTDLEKPIATAEGLLRDHFVIWQSMPLEQATVILEQLRERGFRPIRFRPYADGSRVVTAAICLRDGAPWALDLNSSQRELRKLQQQRTREGLTAVDLAGWKDPGGEHYALLWGPAEGQTACELMVGASAERPEHIAELFAQAGGRAWSPRVWTVFSSGGIPRHCGIWEPASFKPTEIYHRRLDEYPPLVQSSLPLDIAFWRDGEGTDRVTALFALHMPTQLHEHHGSSRSVHLNECETFASKGYWPWSISISTNRRSQVVGSVWRAPSPVELRKARELNEADADRRRNGAGVSPSTVP